MAIFKTLITKTPKTPKTPDPSRAFLTLCSSFSSTQSSSLPLFTTTTIFSSSSSSILRLTSSARFLSPFIRFTPFSGPLFLSSPPWQLLQFATPLYLQGEFILRKAETLTPKLPFPIKLKFAPVGKVGLGNLVEKKEALPGRDGEEGFFNVPNLISISRMVSGPFLGWMIINEWYLPAFVGLAVSGATDWLDGYMARRMGINSVVGSYLDPLADKVLIGSVALAMVKMDLLQPWLVGLVVLRDVGLVSGAFYKRASTLDWQWKSWSEFTNLDGTHPQKVEPLFLSKVNTVFQLVLVAAALLQPEFGTEETRIYVDYLSWLVASTTVASTAAYGAQHLRNGSRAIAKQSFSGRKS